MANPSRNLPDPGFAGDTGAAVPAVTTALEAYARDPEAGYSRALAVLQTARLLVPVVAMAGEVELDERGLARDKTSDMASVLLRGKDGRLALLAFTGAESMRRWNPQARPVPVTAATAARAAVQDHAAAMVVDVAGPVVLVVREEDLRALAEGYTLADVAGSLAWVKASG
jgi:hypothetical protein